MRHPLGFGPLTLGSRAGLLADRCHLIGRCTHPVNRGCHLTDRVADLVHETVERPGETSDLIVAFEGQLTCQVTIAVGDLLHCRHRGIELAADAAADQPGNQNPDRKPAEQQDPYQSTRRRRLVGQGGALAVDLLVQAGHEGMRLSRQFGHQRPDLGAHQIDVGIGLVTTVHIEHLVQCIDVGRARDLQALQGVGLFECQAVFGCSGLQPLQRQVVLLQVQLRVLPQCRVAKGEEATHTVDDLAPGVTQVLQGLQYANACTQARDRGIVHAGCRHAEFVG